MQNIRWCADDDDSSISPSSARARPSARPTRAEIAPREVWHVLQGSTVSGLLFTPISLLPSLARGSAIASQASLALGANRGDGSLSFAVEPLSAGRQ
jgi:hypothetical protein